jgi:large subunit ribosomal protein L15
MGKKKTQKMRGSKTCGYGSKKKHRGAGSRGGKGMAGSKTHKIFKTLKEDPNYFYHKKLKKKNQDVVINLKDLGKFKETKINLKELSYTKLLGDGEINKKFEITINKWSKQAEEKIKKAGGVIKKPEVAKKKESKTKGKTEEKTYKKETKKIEIKPQKAKKIMKRKTNELKK